LISIWARSLDARLLTTARSVPFPLAVMNQIRHQAARRAFSWNSSITQCDEVCTSVGIRSAANERGLSWDAIVSTVPIRVPMVGSVDPSVTRSPGADRLPGLLLRLRDRVPRLSGLDDQAVAARATQAGARVCIAREFGFRTWAELAEATDRAKDTHYSRLPPELPWKQAEAAIWAGDAATLRSLLRQYPGLELEDPGETLLGVAAQPEAGQVPRDVVDVLIEAGSPLDGALGIAHVSTSRGAVSLQVDGNALPPLPGADLSIPVVHQGDLLGAISILMPKDKPLRPAGEQLVADVASQASLVLSNAGLIEDLRASRQRLVTAQDEARRRLERNIHDGAQQDLVALAIKLQLADVTADDNPAEAKQLLGELKADVTGALENLRNLARGIYPPLLADLGLVAALTAQAGKSPLPVAVEADRIGRFGQDIEAAVYFCCLEALQNTAKYAHATKACIALQAHDGTLCFTVSDNGARYDTRRTPMGAGMRNMADRLAALGGLLEVRSAPSQGTTITGHLPIPVTSGGH
jgi:signal transduction histidine kinase